MNSKNWTVNPLLNWFGSSNLPWPTIWVGSEVVKRGGTKQKESCLTNLKKYNIIYIENEKKIRKKRPEPPWYFYFDTDNCYCCKNKNGCGGCKFLKKYIHTKQKNK